MKRITFLMTMLFVFFGLQAQTAKVQGVPHPLAKSGNARAAVVYPNIDFDKIIYTVGSGKKMSALVVKWDDGKGSNCNLVWGYMWSTPEQGTGEAMLRAVAKADPRFYLLAYNDPNHDYGYAYGGIGFDLNGNGNIKLIKDGVSYSLTDGICITNQYDFDSYASNDSQDHWRSGWMNGYWSYWAAESADSPYDYSNIGASGRILTDGSVDGWSFMSDMNNWDSNDMSGAVCYVTPPAITQSGNVELSIKTPRATSPKVKTVYNLEDFYSGIAGSTDGDTIQFYAGLRGQVFENTTTVLTELPDVKNLTLIGNGVVIHGGSGLYLNGMEVTNNVSVIDFTFRNIKGEEGVALFANEKCNLNVEKCIFEDIECEWREAGAAINFQGKNGEILNVYNCRFSNNTSKAGGSVRVGTASAATTEKVYANIISCTFEGNQSGKKANSVYVVNWPAMQIVNCVFENDKTDNGLPIIGLSRINELPAEKFKMAYNLVEGSVSTPEDLIKRLSDTDHCAASFENDVLTLANGEYQVVKDGLAYNRLPANTAIEGITMPKKDISGMAIDYTKATHTGASQQVFGTKTEVDYTKGVFVVNEDWFGHQNSTVNFLTNEGEWYYRVFQKENEGMELGASCNFGTIYGDKFYIVGKQAKDGGASVTGGRLTVCDAKTMKCIKQFPVISEKEGKSNADGRAFLGVNEHKGYISTNNGIHILDMDNMEIKGQVSGSGNPNDDQYGSLYKGQVGTMLRINEKVFAVHQSAGLLVIDANADTLITVVKAPKEMVNGKETERGFGSVVLSKDGNLWLSVAANTTGSGATAPYIYKVNPATCDTTRINMPEGIYPPANSWYAWTADCFSSSKQNNCLYWNGGNGSWFAGKNIMKYDIDKNEFKVLADYNDTDWSIYGGCLRVDPVSDNIYVSLYHGFQDPTHVLFKYDNEGKELAQYPMINNYWFPAMPIFPDNEAPVVTTVSPVTHESYDPLVVSLAGLATDADNQNGAIVKTVKSISNEEVLAATIINGDLKIAPKGIKGSADVTLKVNSNGKVTETVIAVEITKGGSGIDDEQIVRSAYSNGQTLFVNNCEGFTFGLYNANGQLIDNLQVDSDRFSASADVPAGIYYLKGNSGKQTVTFKVILK